MRKTCALLLAAALAAPARAGDEAAAELTDAAAPDAGAAREAAARLEAERPLFAVTERDGHSHLTVHAGQLETPFLLTASVSRGVGERWLYSGTASQWNHPFLFVLRRAGGNIQLWRRNMGFRAAEGTERAAAVRESFPDVLLAEAPVVEENAEAGFAVVKAADLFLADLTDVRASVAEGYQVPASEVSLNAERSRLESVSAHRANVEIEATLAFDRAGGFPSATLPDARSLRVGVHYSVSAPPDPEGFEVRRADPRVNLFSMDFRDFSSPDLAAEGDPVQRLAYRWRLERVDPEAEVSDVRDPLVFWLDRSVPREYRDAVRAGILSWNAAFEAAGLRGAIVVREVDRDMGAEELARFDPADAAYNVVRWFMGADAGSSFATPRVDPRTGEIYSAAIMLSDLFVRGNGNEIEAAAGEGHLDPGPELRALLSAPGLSASDRAALISEYLTEVAAHEMGHALGFGHNFAGSVGAGPGEISRSVMDYLPYRHPESSGDLRFQAGPGSFDFNSVRYAYGRLPAGAGEREEALDAIAAAAGPYAGEQDVRGIDPDAYRFDLGDDAVAYASGLASRGETLWARAAGRQGPEVVPSAHDALLAGLGMRQRAAERVLPLIGGVRTGRLAAGSPDRRARPVSAEEQRRALDFLAAEVFAADAFAAPPELVLAAVPDPAEHGAGLPLVDVPAYAATIQGQALSGLFQPARLARLRAHEDVDPASALPVEELFARVAAAIWGELSDRQVAITASRRRLQAAHLRILIELARGDSFADAAQARADLAELSRKARRARSHAADSGVQAHLDEVVRLADSVADDGRAVAAR